MSESLVQNAADSKQVRKAKKAHTLTEQQRRADLKELMQLPAFQRVAREMLGWCHVWKPSYDPEGSDRETTFREGERNIGLRLFGEMERANAHVFYTQILLPGAQQRNEDARKAEQTHGES